MLIDIPILYSGYSILVKLMVPFTILWFLIKLIKNQKKKIKQIFGIYNSLIRDIPLRIETKLLCNLVTVNMYTLAKINILSVLLLILNNNLIQQFFYNCQ